MTNWFSGKVIANGINIHYHRTGHSARREGFEQFMRVVTEFLESVAR